MDVKIRIGQRIKELRDAKGMAQKDLAYAAELIKQDLARDKVFLTDISDSKSHQFPFCHPSNEAFVSPPQ